MEDKPSFFHALASKVIVSRSKLPKWLNKILDTISFKPDSLVSKIASIILGAHREKNHPNPSTVPDSKISIYIAPTNYAGQGSSWAKALTDPSAQRVAINLAIDLPNSFGFNADTHVPVAVYNHSKKWQKKEFSAVRKFTHVLIEAEKPLFGSLFGRDVTQEISELKAAGVSVAFISHGDDIRSPESNMELTRWSPYYDDKEYRNRMQNFVNKNLAIIKGSKLPAFVSTPDLL
ncbi:MAG: hypothetical protein KF916_06150, partial [Microbacteriaceae bacterium]|nr:hypothetical protein [Microbacteriaceae bacterium]